MEDGQKFETTEEREGGKKENLILSSPILIPFMRNYNFLAIVEHTGLNKPLSSLGPRTRKN